MPCYQAFIVSSMNVMKHTWLLSLELCALSYPRQQKTFKKMSKTVYTHSQDGGCTFFYNAMRPAMFFKKAN